MKKFALIIAAAIALSACDNKPAETPAASNTPEASTEVVASPVAENTASETPASQNTAAATESTMPEECKAYLNQMQEMIKDNPTLAQQFDTAIKQTEESWKHMPADQVKAATEACVQANDAMKNMPKAK